MKKILVTISLIIFITLIAGSTFARTGTVNTDGLNLRKTASTSAEVITQLDKNAKVEILEELDDWYKVSYNNQEGYLKKQYLDAEDAMPTNAENADNGANENPNIEGNSNNKSTLMKDAVVYALPVLNATQVANLQVNTQVEVISKVGKWYYVMSENIAGWILASKLSGATVSEPSNNTENNVADNNVENNLTNSAENNATNNNAENIATSNDNGNSETSSKFPMIMYVSADAVNVRDKASTDSDIVASKSFNDEVTVTGISGDWYTVNVNGTKGYIRKDFLSESKK